MTNVQPINAKPSDLRIRLKSLIGGMIPVLLMGIILFAAAGRLDWAPAWGLLAVHVAGTALVVAFVSPQLLENRSKKEGTKGWDKTLMPLMSVIGLLALIVAGLDQRFGWSGRFPLSVELAALAVLVLGYLLLDWAMVSNKYFTTMVRIQEDLDHATARGGPYAIVRHPGYAGLILCVLAQPLLLGSLYALIPAAITLVILVVRTSLEDRTLQEELAGYKDYAGQIAYRLLPGVW